MRHVRPILSIALFALGLGYVAQAEAPRPKMDEPVVVTRQMLADLICAVRSDHVAGYEYKGAEQKLVVTYNSTWARTSAILAGMSPEKVDEYLEARKQRLRPGVEAKVEPILALICKYVDGMATVEYTGF